MKKIIMFEGDIETQGYFSIQMKKTFEVAGHEVLLYDFRKEKESLSKLFRFVERGNTVMVSFNFHGMTPGDVFLDENGTWFWDDMEIPCYNIVVDHPFYYHRFLSTAPKDYIHLSIDRYHVAYMERFCPEIKLGPFLPLGGTPLYEKKDIIPMNKRPMDICFTGNYTPPSKFETYITRLGDEYTEFYYGMIRELLDNPYLTLEDVAERHIRKEIPEVTEAELKETMGNLIFIDLYIRFTMRGKVVKTLVDAGYQVHVFGEGWEDLECKHPENIVNGKSLNSQECLEKISNSRLSLNVMPWFKDGAHDRVFNTMLNGAVCVTDSSIYLDEILKDDQNAIIYDLTKIEQLPERIGKLLNNPEKLQQIADSGYETALHGHTWADRAKVVEQLFEK